MTEPTINRRTIRSSLKHWNFARREAALYESAMSDLPTWRAANQARKHLAGIVAELANGMPTPTSSVALSQLDATTARQLASVNLGALIVRGTSALISLIGCGHEREALAFDRANFEAFIRGRQLADDPSGDVARKLLAGRRPGSLKSAARRYGGEKDIAVLDRFAHPDLLGLTVISVVRPNGVEADLEVMPQRGNVAPANQLLIAARRAAMFSTLLADVFDEIAVEIPGYLSGQLKHYKEHPLPPGI